MKDRGEDEKAIDTESRSAGKLWNKQTKVHAVHGVGETI